MQEYGLIMTDKGGALVTYAEDPRPYMAANGGVDPYTLLFDPTDLVPDGVEKYLVLSEIPVERLQEVVEATRRPTELWSVVHVENWDAVPGRHPERC